MGNNYKQLTNNVRNRRNPDFIPLTKSFSDEFRENYSDVFEYVWEAMTEVDGEYTSKSKKAVDAIKNTLNHIPNITFEIQGSVMTDTHIKGHSDIDLLVVDNRHHTSLTHELKQTLVNLPIESVRERELIKKQLDKPKYTGDTAYELMELRMKCETLLSRKYIHVDTSKPKSIEVINTTYNTKVDVVVSNNAVGARTVLYGFQDFRGIQVFNKDEKSKGVVTYPFLSIKLINDRSKATAGRLKRMIRFLKNLRSDFNININSFEIYGMVYDIPLKIYAEEHYLKLVEVLYLKILNLITDINAFNNLKCLADNEYVFRGKRGKSAELEKLFDVVSTIYNDIQKAERSVA